VLTSYSELLDWLHELGLDSYAQQFVREELFLDVLADVDEKTLEKMGIATGHQLKIMKACKVLKGKNTPRGGSGRKRREDCEMRTGRGKQQCLLIIHRTSSKTQGGESRGVIPARL
jgi:hypothetical protein